MIVVLPFKWSFATAISSRPDHPTGTASYNDITHEKLEIEEYEFSIKWQCAPKHNTCCGAKLSMRWTSAQAPLREA
jgi:hypothetical protein